jgi:hypothetical protein
MKVTTFKFFNVVIEQLPLEEMLERIKTGFYSQTVERLRERLQGGDEKGFNEGKRGLMAFTICASYDGGRKEEYRTDYWGNLVLDLDKLPHEEMGRVLKLIRDCRFTLACFVSPSGRGLKIITHVNTGATEHLRAFLRVQRYYEELTGVKIDASGKDISRLTFVSYDPDLYFNPGAEVFEVQCDNEIIGDSGENCVGEALVATHFNADPQIEQQNKSINELQNESQNELQDEPLNENGWPQGIAVKLIILYFLCY